MNRLLILVSVLLFSCRHYNSDAKPIEKYKGKGVVVIREPLNSSWTDNRVVRCKTKDSIFNIEISAFDAKNLKVGDTIK